MLKTLCELCGTSGYENEVRDYITDILTREDIPFFVDNVGNIVATWGKTPENIALFAHMDEVGFGVRGFTQSGLIKFASVGGILEKILPSHAVVIGKNKIKGVIGNVPKHLNKNGENNLTYDDFFIDIGAKTKEEAQKEVSIGEAIYWISEYVEFGNNLIKAKALDDRAGVSVILNLLLKKEYSFTACFTTREEIGVIGAKTILGKIKPKNALVLEVTTCADVPCSDKKTTLLGEGVALSVMDRGSVSDFKFNEEIISIAKKNKIPLQKKLTTMGGNDASAVSYFGGGIKTATLSLPGRYIHSPVTVISKDDYASMEALTQKILEEKQNG